MRKMRDWNHAIATLEALGDWHIVCGKKDGRRMFRCWIMLGDKTYIGNHDFEGYGFTAMQAVENALEKMTADCKTTVRRSKFRVVG